MSKNPGIQEPAQLFCSVSSVSPKRRGKISTALMQRDSVVYETSFKSVKRDRTVDPRAGTVV